jgi:hypothetical protein
MSNLEETDKQIHHAYKPGLNFESEILSSQYTGRRTLRNHCRVRSVIFKALQKSNCQVNILVMQRLFLCLRVTWKSFSSESARASASRRASRSAHITCQIYIVFSQTSYMPTRFDCAFQTIPLRFLDTSLIFCPAIRPNHAVLNPDHGNLLNSPEAE